MLTRFVIVTLIWIIVDFYCFQAVKTVSHSGSPKTKAIVYGIYWVITVVTVVGFLLFAFGGPELLPRKLRTYLFAIIMGFFLAKLVAIIFILVDDIRRAIQWTVGKIFNSNSVVAEGKETGITRSVFLSWLSLALGGTLFTSLIYGFGNKYKYDIKRVQLSFDNLPKGFKGMKILHISDIHSGSFTDKEAVHHGVKEIIGENADLILFTGDLVNDKATEMDNYLDIFNQLKAPMGVYSTLGNHDYGDYVRWPIDGISKEQNLENLKGVHANLGWRLLMNEHVVLEKNGDQIVLLGIENWGAKANFPKYGRMDLAHSGTEKY
jgi:predicted phosphodiesterase